MTECFPPGKSRKAKLLDELASLGRDYRAHAEPDHMSVAGGDAIVPRKKYNSFEEKMMKLIIISVDISMTWPERREGAPLCWQHHLGSKSMFDRNKSISFTNPLDIQLDLNCRLPNQS